MPAIEALLGLNALWQFEFLLGLLLRATVILTVAWLADRLLRHAPARQRVWLWSVATVILLVQSIAPLRLGNLIVDTPAALTSVDNPVPMLGGVRDNVAFGLATIGLVDAERHTTSTPSRGPGALAWLFAGWAAMVLIRWARLWNAGRRVRALLHSGTAVPPNIVQAAYQLMPQAGQYVRVVTTEIATPFTFGWRHPVVSLPTSAIDWNDELLRSVLLHEFTHVRRGDWCRQILATAVSDLYWFLPLARIGLDRLTLAAELSCDEQVLSRGVEPRVYAAHLLAIVGNTPTPRLATAACFAEPSDMETRMHALLRSGRRPLGRSRGILALLMVMAMPLLAAVTPQLGSCEDSRLPLRMEWTSER